MAVSDGAASAAVGAARAAVSVVCMLFFYSAHTHIFFFLFLYCSLVIGEICKDHVGFRSDTVINEMGAAQ